MKIAYDGSAYSGFQIQKSAKTVEGELTNAIHELTGEEVGLIGGSRTDSGVHALCNIAVFDTESQIPGEKIKYALNSFLPEDIRIMDSYDTDNDFHPRHVNTKKTYEYTIINSRIEIPTERLYSHHVYGDLNVEAMNSASKSFIGEHDFAAFCAAGAQVTSTVRTIYDISVTSSPISRGTGNRIVIRVSGNGFLYNMVRIIAGTLLEVGRGSIKPERVSDIIESKQRKEAGPTAPACGLTLVNYEFL